MRFIRKLDLKSLLRNITRRSFCDSRFLNLESKSPAFQRLHRHRNRKSYTPRGSAQGGQQTRRLFKQQTQSMQIHIHIQARLQRIWVARALASLQSNTESNTYALRRRSIARFHQRTMVEPRTLRNRASKRRRASPARRWSRRRPGCRRRARPLRKACWSRSRRRCPCRRRPATKTGAA